MQDQWKILVTDYLEQNMDWEAHQLRAPNVRFEAYQLKHVPASELIKYVRDADIVVVDMAHLTGDIIANMRRCRLVIRHGVGYDNVDVAALTRKGILFINIPDYCIEEVAEQAVMLILVATRKYQLQQQSLHRSIEKGQWDYQGLYPIFCVTGKKLGIIGCGRIGSMVLKMMRGFDLEILVCDPYLTTARKSELGIETIPLETVLREADIITLHTPLNAETRYMIDEPQFKLMKATAYVINTARGGIISQAALIKACREKWIAGAATDVFDLREPPAPGDPLIGLQNLDLTPHLGWYSEESRMRIRVKVVENIKLMLNGELPRNIVNPEVIT